MRAAQFPGARPRGDAPDARRPSPVPHAEVTARAEAISRALTLGEGRLQAGPAIRARTVTDRTLQRLRFGGRHTVVALAGATGSGKSSLFNALAGMEISRVGARRPTTAEPVACVWGAGGDPAGLLDWVGVPDHDRVARETVLDADRQSDLHGLVLLDLPDHDTTSVEHRLEVDRLVERVDLVVWVVDPQKYADEALHRYLRRLVGHQGSMLVVLNQLDRLTAAEARTCTTDLRRLLDADGLTEVRVLTTSARTGAGVGSLRAVVADLVGGRAAYAGRAAADLAEVVDDLRPSFAPAEPDPGSLPGADQLVAALAQAAGLPVLLDSADAEYRRSASRVLGWPPAVWWASRRADPVDRLGVAPEVAAELRRLAAPRTLGSSGASQEPRADLAVYEVTLAATAGMPSGWSDAVRRAVAAGSVDLSRTLDERIRQVPLSWQVPLRWRLLQLLQLALLLLGAAGLAWSLVAVVGGAVSPDPARTPLLGPVPVPAVMLAVGFLVGGLLALLARWASASGCRHRRERLAAELRGTVSDVARERVLDPVAGVVTDHRQAREALGFTG